MSLTIRPATAADLGAINDIYNHYVLNTHITFDEQPWPLQQRQQWFSKFTGSQYSLNVAVENGIVRGFSYTSSYRPKSAYNRSAEVTIYTAHAQAPKGTGTKLYQQLIADAEGVFHRLYAIIALPNEGSIGLHKKLGFKQVGELSDVGYKFGQYYSTVILEKQLER